MLRRRKTEELKVWQNYLYFIFTALNKLPNIETTVYRGIPSSLIETIKTNYKKKRPIHWSGFSSATEQIEVAKEFAGPNGILFRMKIFTGKSIEKCSFIPGEKEILLSPNLQFKVMNPLSVEGDGFCGFGRGTFKFFCHRICKIPFGPANSFATSTALSQRESTSGLACSFCNWFWLCPSIEDGPRSSLSCPSNFSTSTPIPLQPTQEKDEDHKWTNL